MGRPTETKPSQSPSIIEIAKRIEEIPTIIIKTTDSSNALKLALEQSRLIEILIAKTEKS